MFYQFFYPLRDIFFGFNVFKYITFRAAMAALTAFFLSVLFGGPVIRMLRRLNTAHGIERAGFEKIAGQQKHKESVPTMGGILIIGSVAVATLCWSDLRNPYLWIALLSMIWLGLIGFVDDYLKRVFNNAKGLQALTKLTGQLVLSVAVGFLLYDGFRWDSVHVPFLKDFVIVLGPFYVAFVCLVLVGSSNAVNLTDGLDGLAVGCAVFIALTYAIMSYLSGNAIFSDYLNVPFIAGAGELTVFCSSIVGAGLGFLWFNSYPASVFMGDTGSLGLGGALGIVAVLIKKELLLLLVGGIFVAEALSVILQVASFKMRKKRIFLMAPLHHHFQLKGWSETKVVIRFWIVSVMLSLAGLASLKLM